MLPYAANDMLQAMRSAHGLDTQPDDDSSAKSRKGRRALLPLQPTSVLVELARATNNPDERESAMYTPTTDPDRFISESNSLQPDPIYMGLREAIAAGPIGRFLAWLDARAEAREERARIQTTTPAPVRLSPRQDSKATDRDDLAA